MFEKEIAAGIGLLNEKGPGGWREQVIANIDYLDISDAYSCILGIAYRYIGDGYFPYSRGLKALGLWEDIRLSCEYGFSTGSARDDLSDQLTREWKAALQPKE
jgi:hypothetical protein